jgi:hypothetical protein
MTELTYTETLRVTHCYCGIAVAVPQTLHRRANESDEIGIYCPLGHKFFFTETTQQKLDRAQQALKDAEKRERAVRENLRAEERSHIATRGHLTRHKKRAKAGVCPCCHRTFKQLSAHMSNKHPDFDPEAA